MSIKIKGKEYYGFVDHDYKFLKSLSMQNRIKWFKYRYNKILFNPIKDINKIAKGENRNGLLENEDTSIYTIVMLVLCVGMDLLGGFYDGRKGDTSRSTFETFIDEYLDKKDNYSKSPLPGVSKFSTLLYLQFRCGLAHNLTIKKVGFCYGENYFRRDNDAYYVSVDKLFEDLNQGFKNYMAHVERNKSKLRSKFNERFNHIFIAGK